MTEGDRNWPEARRVRLERRIRAAVLVAVASSVVAVEPVELASL